MFSPGRFNGNSQAGNVIQKLGTPSERAWEERATQHHKDMHTSFQRHLALKVKLESIDTAFLGKHLHSAPSAFGYTRTACTQHSKDIWLHSIPTTFGYTAFQRHLAWNERATQHSKDSFLKWTSVESWKHKLECCVVNFTETSCFAPPEASRWLSKILRPHPSKKLAKPF